MLHLIYKQAWSDKIHDVNPLLHWRLNINHSYAVLYKCNWEENAILILSSIYLSIGINVRFADHAFMPHSTTLVLLEWKQVYAQSLNNFKNIIIIG